MNILKNSIKRIRELLLSLLLLFPTLLFAIEPAKVSFKCNIHTINKVEGQPKDPLDDEHGGYCIIDKSKHKSEQVGHMGLILLKDSFTGNIWAYDLLCPSCYAKEGIKRAIRMQTIIVARCETCNSEWQNIHMGSAEQTNQEAKYWLTTYKTELKGDILYVSNW